MNRILRQRHRLWSWRPYETFEIFAVLTWIVVAVVGYSLVSYLNITSFPNVISFEARDTPPVPASVLPSPLGNHSFGDFLQPYWQAQLSPSPYLGGSSSYLPIANGVFWTLNHFPFWIALGLTQLFASCLLIYTYLQGFPEQLGRAPRIRVVTWSVILSAPFIASIDRGNIQLLTVSLMSYACLLVHKRRFAASALAIGIAGALKGYPILLVVLFFRHRTFRYAFVSLFSFLGSSVLALAMFDGGLGRNLTALRMSLLSSQNELAHLYLGFNNSAAALAGSVISLFHMNASADVATNSLRMCSVLLLGATIWVSRSCAPYAYVTSSVTSAMVLLTEYSPAYVLGVLFCASFWLLKEVPRDSLDRKCRWLISVAVAVVLVPKQLPLKFVSSFNAGKPTLAAVLNPVLLLVCQAISLVGASGIKRAGNRSDQQETV